MLIRNIEFENFNGLSKKFNLGEKENIFIGSNGCGKTTSLDCLAILLFGESFSYQKSLEKHIDIKDKTKVATLKMNVDTGKKIIDEENKETEVLINFEVRLAYNNKGEFNTTKFINGTKTTQKDYDKRICETFKIPLEILELKKVNVLRCLIDPNELENSDITGYYDFIKYLTNVVSIEEFSQKKEEFSPIRLILSQENYSIPNAKKAIKTHIASVEEDIKTLNVEITQINTENDKIEETIDIKEYNSKVEEFYKVQAQQKKLNEKINELELEIENSKKEDLINYNEELTEVLNNKNKLLINKNKLLNDINLKNIEIDKMESLIAGKINENEKVNIQLENLKNSSFEFKEIICQECGKIANSNDKKKTEKEFNDKIKSETKNLEQTLKANLELIETTKVNLQDSINYYNNLVKENTNNDNDININDKLEQELKQKDLQKDYSQKTLDLQKDLVKTREEKNNISETLSNLYIFIQDNQTALTTIERNRNKILLLEKDAEKRNEFKADLEVKQVLLNDFSISYAKEVEKAISSVFGDIKINVIKEGKTTGKEKVNCYALDNESKPFFNYNTAPQVALGCKLIKKIKDYLGIKGLPILFDIVDNIGEKAFNDILNYCDSQLFCTMASFEENNKLKLINNIKENK